MGRPLHRMPVRGRPRAAMTDAPLVTIEAIRAAAGGLHGVAARTPLVALGDPADGLWLKAESLQPIGAFKIRGAYHVLAGLSPDVRARGVVTASSGNHGQGVARAARLLGCPAVVVMPTDAPAVKRRRVEEDGARLVLVGGEPGERGSVAGRIAAERGMTLVASFDDDRIIAGQGTVGLEIGEDRPDVALVLVPIGGGGLASGVATAVKALCPTARVIGVEPALAADARESLERGRIVTWPAADTARTIADGTRVNAIGQRPFVHLRAHLDGIVTVSEAEIAAGVRLAAEQARLVVEPSGALVVAAMVYHAAELGLRPGQGPVVGIVSGGNVDPDAYGSYLAAPLPG